MFSQTAVSLCEVSRLQWLMEFDPLEMRPSEDLLWHVQRCLGCMICITTLMKTLASET